MPGSPLLNLSLFFIQSLPQPVLKNTRIAFLDVGLLHVLLLQGGAQVGDGDLLADIHRRALDRLDVEQVAAGEERLAVLDAELLQAVGVVISSSVTPL